MCLSAACQPMPPRDLLSRDIRRAAGVLWPGVSSVVVLLMAAGGAETEVQDGTVLTGQDAVVIWVLPEF